MDERLNLAGSRTIMVHRLLPGKREVVDYCLCPIRTSGRLLCSLVTSFMKEGSAWNISHCYIMGEVVNSG